METVMMTVDVDPWDDFILESLLIVFPWTRNLIINIWDVSDPAPSLGTSPALFARGQGGFSELRELLCDKLHVDPLNVRLLSKSSSPTPPTPFGQEFTPAYHHAFHKLFRVVAHALACRSH
ncbi:hemoglobin beta subunit A [Podarcis lilfordi]|uniref:Hemoglobin beta subunit A n=1 Tax=Podarcis lilfordi TaxID=74358 RepID=A0AA35KBG5_9SAUR|nr:hemoglobin beta subunit A [Podarcis lilfordi]